MKKMLLTILITAGISFGLTSFYVNAMAAEHPSEHPTAEEAKSDQLKTEEAKSEHPGSEGVKAEHPASEEATLERLMSEDELAADEKSRGSKPKDHPSH